MIALALLRKGDEYAKMVTLEQAFRILEGALRQSYPDLPDGYTWREALITMKKSHGESQEWVEIEKVLKKYEAIRYGGIRGEDVETGSVLRLAHRLRRRGKVVS